MAGLWLIASTDAAGVLFRASTGLAYDGVAIRLAHTWPAHGSSYYFLECATGRAPAWAPQGATSQDQWTVWLTTPTGVRTCWRVDVLDAPALSRFLATYCLSPAPPPWTVWSETSLGALGERTLVYTSSAPLSVWELMQLGGGNTVFTSEVDTWLAAMERGLPPLIDLNTLLGALGRPARTPAGSVAAVLVVAPAAQARCLHVPYASGAVALWQPCLDTFTLAELEDLNFLLHSPELCNDPLYDTVRACCRKKITHFLKDASSK